MKEVRFEDEEWIFAKGHLGSSLFVVHTGEVAVVSGSHRLATFRQGEFFGELALLDSEPRSATRATCSTWLRRTTSAAKREPTWC